MGDVQHKKLWIPEFCGLICSDEKTKGIASSKRARGGIGRPVVMIVGNTDVSSLSRDLLLGSSALSQRER